MHDKHERFLKDVNASLMDIFTKIPDIAMNDKRFVMEYITDAEGNVIHGKMDYGDVKKSNVLLPGNAAFGPTMAENIRKAIAEIAKKGG